MSFDKKAYQKLWYQNNKAHVLEYNEQWRKNNPKKAAKVRHKYYKNNKEKLRLIQDEWNINNIEKVRKYKSEWRNKNKGRVNSWTAKRYAAKLKRTPSWLTPLHFQQIELFYIAANDLTIELNIKMSVDHIVPLQGENVSGLHVPWNLQVIPLLDNCIKNSSF